MEFPTTLLEFADQFPDDEACWRYLRSVRWPEGFRCPRCSTANASYLERRRLFQCAQCRYQVSVTAGTIFHATRTPLRKWFLALFFFARHKPSVDVSKPAMGDAQDDPFYLVAASFCKPVPSATATRSRSWEVLPRSSSTA